MGRAPCCDKMGLKKGPWTHQEDHILVDFIRRNGHGNWRALPKQAGLLRCGKSCRLRWINYLRPDIKRGNFSPEEEDAIIKLHQRLGNRWSAIASRLPGRTDNEIKNVWNTHLKKRLLRMGVDPVTHAVTKDSILPKTGDSLISLDYSEYIKEADASMEKNSFAASQEKVSLDYSEYSGPRSPLMEYENLAEAQFDYSDYNGATSPLMAEHNLTKAFLVDSPTRVSNFSDAFYNSQNLSTEIPSSLSSIESEVISGDSSSSSLDWLQSSCIDSFDEPIGYSPHPPAVEDERMFIFENQDFESEIRRFDVMLEQSSDENAEYLMSDNPEDDFLSGIDDEYTNTHLFKSIELSTKDDESDGISYWLNVLSQAGSSPMLL